MIFVNEYIVALLLIIVLFNYVAIVIVNHKLEQMIVGSLYIFISILMIGDDPSQYVFDQKKNEKSFICISV